MVVRVVVPTLNAAADWSDVSPPLLASLPPEQVLIVDSSSTDQTTTLARNAGFRLYSIQQSEFNHGATRQLAAELLPEADILIYITQDAILTTPTSIANLLRPFADPSVAAAYGRQLPRVGAGAIEAHARNFNYPEQSEIRSFASRKRLGFKTIFLSNSFAAYRRSALMAIGGFPGQVIFGEDTIVAARLLMAGSKIAYVAEASVRHSHPYTWTQEFKRYFDIGVLHSRERWLQDSFGGTVGEGKRFVISELSYLRHKDPLRIPSGLIRTGLKLLGYKLGRSEQNLSLGMKRRLSMNRRFWAIEPGSSFR
jgi:rhamnosyltransferase